MCQICRSGLFQSPVTGHSTLCNGIRYNTFQFGCTVDCSPHCLHGICINLHRRIFVSHPAILLNTLSNIIKILEQPVKRWRFEFVATTLFFKQTTYKMHFRMWHSLLSVSYRLELFCKGRKPTVNCDMQSFRLFFITKEIWMSKDQRVRTFTHYSIGQDTLLLLNLHSMKKSILKQHSFTVFWRW